MYLEQCVNKGHIQTTVWFAELFKYLGQRSIFWRPTRLTDHRNTSLFRVLADTFPSAHSLIGVTEKNGKVVKQSKQCCCCNDTCRFGHNQIKYVGVAPNMDLAWGFFGQPRRESLVRPLHIGGRIHWIPHAVLHVYATRLQRVFEQVQVLSSKSISSKFLWSTDMLTNNRLDSVLLPW